MLRAPVSATAGTAILLLLSCACVRVADKAGKSSAATPKQLGKDALRKRSSMDEALAERREAGRRELSAYMSRLLSRFDSFTFFDSGKESNWSDGTFAAFFEKAIRAADDTVQVCTDVLGVISGHLCFWSVQGSRWDCSI